MSKLIDTIVIFAAGMMACVFIMSKEIDNQYISRRHLNVCEYAHLSLHDCVTSAYQEYKNPTNSKGE